MWFTVHIPTGKYLIGILYKLIRVFIKNTHISSQKYLLIQKVEKHCKSYAIIIFIRTSEIVFNFEVKLPSFLKLHKLNLGNFIKK